MPTVGPEDIGPLLRAVRQGARGGAGIPLEELADLLEVSATHLSNVELGHRRLTPNLHRRLLEALRALGAEISTLPQPPGDQ